MSILTHLTPDQVLSQPLPIGELLENSLYYPSSGFDGRVVKFFSKRTNSFVFCDYGVGENALFQEMNHFYGYQVLAHRPLTMEELVPNGWKMKLPPQFNMTEYYSQRDFIKAPFAHWIVYDRLEEFTDDHGAKRFSLIYIGGEGVATYQALYWSNKKCPKILAIIQPGHGFGFNWANFGDPDGPLAWVVYNNRYGRPDTILYGGSGSGYEVLNWKGYRLMDTITSYYGQSGTVTVWERTG
jgi:hypothetical protein